MTQEEKNLLLKDLCARLPHKVKINNEIQGDFEIYGICEDCIYGRSKTCHIDFSIEKIKPYLRPMSSMTDVERQCYETMSRGYTVIQQTVFFDWLNKKMFDYRGLIPMGLAIDCTNLNIY